MAECAGTGDSEKARDARTLREQVIREFRRHIRVPPRPRGLGGLGRSRRAGAGPFGHAGLGLEPCQPRPWRVSLTEGDGQEHGIPDLVARDFTAAAPGEKMVGDITYIPTWEGWRFLATVIDCHTKAVIGWAIDDNYKTPLIETAIEMAARSYPFAAGPSSIPAGAVITRPAS
jgi:transposase InsO family protein